MSRISPSFRSAVVAVGFVAAACGGPAESELDIDRTASGMGESSCRAQNIANSADIGYFEYSAAAGYSNPNCYKAVLDDLWFVETDRIIETVVSDEGPVPTTKSACQSLYVAVDFYTYGTPTYQQTLSRIEGHGIWLDLRPFYNVTACVRPSVTIPTSAMTNNGHYRISATSRVSSTSSQPTRALSIVSERYY